MDAIKLLQEQHREVEQLFKAFEAVEEGDHPARKRLFLDLADLLTLHTAIEERHFYPAIKARAKQMEGQILESVEEHLSVKRVIADLLDLQPSNPRFDAKMKVLKEEVEHHVNEEEVDLFVSVRSIFSDAEMEGIGVRMEEMLGELIAEGSPHEALPRQLEEATPRV